MTKPWGSSVGGQPRSDPVVLEGDEQTNEPNIDKQLWEMLTRCMCCIKISECFQTQQLTAGADSIVHICRLYIFVPQTLKTY